jgi:hypothetical protein
MWSIEIWGLIIFDRLNHHRLMDYHVHRLEQLGYQVNLESQPDAA